VRVLVLNAGSSSLKASVVEPGRRETVTKTTVNWGSDATRVADRRATVAAALEALWADGADRESVAGVGHRVVHGGLRFREPVLVDDGVLTELDELGKLAPLHNPVAVDAIRAARELLPGVAHVAAFDTAFHKSLEPAGYVYPLPWRWYSEWGIRRFGFHGLAVEWDVRRAGELLASDPADLQLLVAHLGSGCSVTAVKGGRSVATSMGLTPLEGMMMGTRAGSFDPGVMLRLLDDGHVTVAEMTDALEHESGLLGVSGVSGDMREVSAAAASGNAQAALAINMFCRRAAGYIAGAATSLERIDALVFSGGIGEHAGDVRARIVDRLAVLGIAPISPANVSEDAMLSAGGGPAVLRIEAREDVVIAEAVTVRVRRR
jgi:acetate kinase